MTNQNDEQTVAIVSFTGAIKREVVRALNKLKQDESLSEFKISIKATGRVDGDAKINFAVSDCTYSSGVEGNNLDDCIEELLRRRGWTKRHEPLMLTSNEKQRADADRVYTNTPAESEIPY